MAKKDDKSLEIVIFLLGIIAIIPLFVFAYIKYNEIKNRYLIGDYARRVIDIGVLKKQLILTGLVAAVSIFATYAACIKSIPLACAMAAIEFFLLVKMSQFAAIKYVGAIIDPVNDRVVLPNDFESYSISDYLNIKFLNDLSCVDTIKLSNIERITRQKSNNIYLHGDFGSRRITFTSKQKRDECMNHILTLSTGKIYKVSEYECV